VLPRVCGCGGVVRSRPVAQAIVLRRVLTGGISTNRCLAVRRRRQVRTPVAVSDHGVGGPGTRPGCFRRVVFGTLLGPEATGPGVMVFRCGFRVLFVSGFLAAPVMRVCVCGVCGTGLLFENYIVDASIFYKKQFPRI
jgi:hypothetical protein